MNTNHSNEHIIRQTQCWLKSIIIGLNFCPFANQEFKKNSIRYRVCDGTDMQSNLQTLAEEFQYLDKHADTETSLLMFEHTVGEFEEFLALIDYANQLLETLGYRSVYQLAHFHPHYRFADVELEDASNYTNRSPYPTLHIIREDSMQKAIESHPDTAKIPHTNIKLARKLGADKINDMLNQCKQTQ